MKERRKTLPPKLKIVADSISEAMNEARKIREVAVAEEVLIQLEKGNQHPRTGEERDRERNAPRKIASGMSDLAI